MKYVKYILFIGVVLGTGLFFIPDFKDDGESSTEYIALGGINDSTIEVLGGGGGGGVISGSGGGGGGGGEYHWCIEPLRVQDYTVTVGVGGTTDTAGPTNSTFAGTGISITAGGGSGTTGATGGAGGGTITPGTVVGCDVGPRTYVGGNGGNGNTTGDVGGGGGGGAGYAGRGGNGSNAVSGVSGGGGGGGAGETAQGGDASGATAGSGGSGGGGNGGAGGGSSGSAGTPATYHIVGGGGGGGGNNSGGGGACGAPGAGAGGGEVLGAGNGCRGEVRITYIDSQITATGGTETTSGIYRTHTFTTSGTFSVTATTTTLYTDIKNSPLATDLVSYWDLDESTGDRLDSHSTNTLAETDSVGSTAGIIGDAANFSNDYLSIADASQTGLDFSNEMSVSFWVKPGSTSGTQPLIQKWLTTGDQRSWQIQLNTDDIYLAASGAGTAASAGSNTIVTNLSNGTWYHILVVFDRGSFTLYKNGAFVQKITGFTGTLFNGTAPFQIGGALTAAIDEVGMWNTILTPSDATNLYNAGAGLPYEVVTGGTVIYQSEFFFQ